MECWSRKLKLADTKAAGKKSVARTAVNFYCIAVLLSNSRDLDTRGAVLLIDEIEQLVSKLKFSRLFPLRTIRNLGVI